ncbi:MAG TPA: transcriptional regulator [Coriobacteriia bacterium]|nr:transcriptional regulator [Coriobacteriia bacterium]
MSSFAFASDPDRVIHEPARLKIMSVLSVVQSADFVYLQHETGLTGGNLSVQLTRLEEAGYIAIEKTFAGKMPRTLASMTPAGRDAFAAYRRYLKGLLGATG